jgi:hypothetical protein
MFKRLLAKYHWIKALRVSEANDEAASRCALRHLDHVERLTGLRPRQAAFKAQELLALREYRPAKRLLSETLNALQSPRDADERYLQIVCLLWRAENFHDVPDASLLWAEAMDLDCSPDLRRQLLLREPPEFHAGTGH